MYTRYPELILIDAIYKLNNLCLLMYILMVVDGNGESEIVALWLVVYEDKDTISHLMDIIEKHNDATNTKCIMADKDMTEREVLAEKTPNAALMICLFHTLRTFCHEITTEKWVYLLLRELWPWRLFVSWYMHTTMKITRNSINY